MRKVDYMDFGHMKTGRRQNKHRKKLLKGISW